MAKKPEFEINQRKKFKKTKLRIDFTFGYKVDKADISDA